ncbi:Auxin responsive SAUR protein [Cynara cardunculus var. scolymus]|uniref:Auxin responsive SAUR protein n=1 Tax=Cynara cardunculus var. scolymus TaxID=59895 RepID=A0A103XSA7_CYNCS|nr:Auxin responsive SAUR protein [Cynara cardunculus var. scolymus]KVH95978.1 Auxin responsive SAUR protein [Cynara cardunculus var. scolymus]
MFSCRFLRILHAKHVFERILFTSEVSNIRKGNFAIYVGERKRRRFVVPISYLEHPLFQKLLYEAEKEFGFVHPMGRIVIPCRVETFINLVGILNCSGEARRQ